MRRSMVDRRSAGGATAYSRRMEEDASSVTPRTTRLNKKVVIQLTAPPHRTPRNQKRVARFQKRKKPKHNRKQSSETSIEDTSKPSPIARNLLLNMKSKPRKESRGT